jgi:PhoPQ-activated pathogenicity-related protein
MKHHISSCLRLAALLAWLLPAAAATAADDDQLPRRTAIDDYVKAPDPAYRWEVVNSIRKEGYTSVVVDLTSQRWLEPDEVNRPEWRHWLTLAIPDGADTDVAMLYIGGGSNDDPTPESVGEDMAQIAMASGTVVAELEMVPNQPLVFHGDGIPRYEDDLIGYTWDQYLETGEARWLARNPMIKSAVRAMDTVTAVLAAPPFERQVDRFVVAGGSKRGWTTWLTGAMDPRVIGIAPIVIDVVNVDTSMRHHFAAYGFWAVAVGNYVDHRIMHRMSDERLREAYDLIDPYRYRHRLTMPKLVLNAAGDQFFLPDSSRFYWDALRGENYLRYVPNADHSLAGSDAISTLIAFHTLLRDGRKPPQLTWNHAPDGTLQAMTDTEPTAVRLWQMTNPEARDFRIETEGPGYTTESVVADADGLYRARVPAPEAGWTAYFLEFEYAVGAATPFKLTTEVTITPDTLPFADKPVDLPTSVTLFCAAADGRSARRIGEEVEAVLVEAGFADAPQTAILGERLYVNWQPTGSIYEGGTQVRDYLESKECDGVGYQLESGPGITLPPSSAR